MLDERINRWAKRLLILVLAALGGDGFPPPGHEGQSSP
jgi:hypothetical protein